jgi:hypothetical protein
VLEHLTASLRQFLALLNQNVHHIFHKSLPLVPVPIQIFETTLSFYSTKMFITLFTKVYLWCQSYFGTFCLSYLHTFPPMKMGQSVPKRRNLDYRRPVNHPEESTRRSEHGESLKSRMVRIIQLNSIKNEEVCILLVLLTHETNYITASLETRLLSSFSAESLHRLVKVVYFRGENVFRTERNTKWVVQQFCECTSRAIRAWKRGPMDRIIISHNWTEQYRFNKPPYTWKIIRILTNSAVPTVSDIFRLQRSS